MDNPSCSCTVILPDRNGVGKRCSAMADRQAAELNPWAGSLIFFGWAVLMRWLLIGLLISVGALLFLAGAVTRHIVRQRRMQSDGALGKPSESDGDIESEIDRGTDPVDIALKELSSWHREGGTKGDG